MLVMTEGIPVHINELASLLREVDPQALARVAQQSPIIGKALGPGITLGEDKSEISLDVAREAGQFAEQALQSASTSCQRAIEIAMKKVRDAKRLRVVSQCVTTIASSGVIASLAAKAPGELICALLALFGSLVSLIADYRGAILADGSNAEKALRELGPLLFDVNLQANKLKAITRYATASELVEVVNAANAIARRVFDLALPVTGWK